MVKEKNKEKIKGKGRHPNSLKQLEKGMFQPGESGNPEGRPVGQRNYKTIYKAALEKIAKENKLTPDEFEDMLVAQGMRLAMKGDYSFYKDTMDRKHGQAIKAVGLVTGKTMGEILDELDSEESEK